MYRTEKYLPNWRRHVMTFAKEAKKINLDFEINAIANDPSDAELVILKKLESEPWFNLRIVPRESIYASWNRGVSMSRAEVYTAWNIDDIRNITAIKDGLELINNNKAATEQGVIVYFSFIYKRYINFLNYNFLVKKILFTLPSFNKEEFSKTMFIGPFFLYTKKAYQRIGIFDEKYTVVGDYEWQIRAVKKDVLFLKSEVVGGIFTNNGKTLSGSKSDKHKAEAQEVYDKYVINNLSKL